MSRAEVRVYVAGASREAERARAFAKRLEELPGVSVGFRWWERAIGAGSDADLSRMERRTLQVECLRGARSADLFVLLVPAAPVVTVGAWVELGAFLALSDVRRVVVVGDVAPPSLFLAGACWARDQKAALSCVGGLHSEAWSWLP